MRVAFVSAVTARHRETDRTARTRRLAEGLVERGHEVTVVCAQWWEGDPDRFEADGLTYHAVSEDPDDPRFAARVPAALCYADPEMVHAVHDVPAHVLGARVGAAAVGAPLLVDWYDVDRTHPSGGALGGVRDRASGWLRRRAARTPATVFTPSRMVKTRVRELGTSEDAVAVLPTGIEFDRIEDVDPADGGDIVYSRRLDADANVESLLLALAELRQVGWTATIIGDGPARDEYERQASDLRIDDRVAFVGDRSVEERLALFRNAHVYVHTARRTPFPVDLCRALACGCAGVVEYHAESAAHELVERRPRGFLATDDAELVDHIDAAADLPHWDVDPDFESFGERAVLAEYLDACRTAMAD